MANFVDKDMTEQARNASLSEYFRSNGYNVKSHGNEMYIDELPGLCVNVQTNSWYYHYEGYGGNNAIDCLTKVLDKDFVTAVSELSHGVSSTPYIKPTAAAPKVQAELNMPERGENYRRVYAYLIKTRCIPKDIVDELVHQHLLYQDVKGNAVFVHTDNDGKIIGGEVQGTITDKRYKGMAEGTGDSLFKIKIGNPDKVYAFESAIDLCSFYAIADKQKLNNAVLVSMGGLKINALTTLTSEYENIKVISCVDNDESGKKFNSTHGFQSFNDYLEQNHVKDWNELLKNQSNNLVHENQNYKHKTR